VSCLFQTVDFLYDLGLIHNSNCGKYAVDLIANPGRANEEWCRSNGSSREYHSQFLQSRNG
jgi:hypothetical protein